jgi:hypothetical protein
MKAKKRQCTAAVIGGGLGGCLAALELANKGYKVCLIEAKNGLLEGTSNVTPGRMGLGFHYIHKETAIVYLHSTIEFVKRYKNSVHPLMIGGDEEQDHPLRRGRYFITKDSLFPKEEILDTYSALQNEYRRLCEEDLSNQVFGDPDDFFQILSPSEYEHDVSDKIVCGVETPEHLLNWPRFKTFVLDEIEKSRNIEVFTSEEIRKIDFDTENNQHILYSYNKESKRLSFEIRSPFIVNCTWERVEEITQAAGLLPVEARKTSSPRNIERTNRLKILVEIKLPDRLKNAHSMFFCMGPHCMFSNMGDGRGLLTYAPVTNFKQSNAITVPRDIAHYLKLNSTDELDDSTLATVRKYGNKIIAGVSAYIPEMSKAELLSVRFGIVVTRGSVDIFDHNSDFHIRNYNGIMTDNYPLGWVNNTCMKLLYAYDNAISICEIAEEQKILRQLVPEKAKEMALNGVNGDEQLQPDKTKALAFVLYRYFSSAELTSKAHSPKMISFDTSKALIATANHGKLLITSGALHTAKSKLVNRDDSQELPSKVKMRNSLN